MEARADYILGKELLSRSNPMTPGADTYRLFIWKVAGKIRGPGFASDEWSVTGRVDNTLDFWSRKHPKSASTVKSQ